VAPEKGSPDAQILVHHRENAQKVVPLYKAAIAVLMTPGGESLPNGYAHSSRDFPHHERLSINFDDESAEDAAQPGITSPEIADYQKLRLWLREAQ
jgi:hypothetical protein